MANQNRRIKRQIKASIKKLKAGTIRDLRDWREETLARMRALILEADPEMIEERRCAEGSCILLTCT